MPRGQADVESEGEAVTADAEYLGRLAQEVAERVVAALPNPPDDRPLLSPEQVAERLGIGERTARKLLLDGRIPSIVLDGGRLRKVEPAALDAYIASLREPENG
jgi:excisionase family DNA binding protein